MGKLIQKSILFFILINLSSCDFFYKDHKDVSSSDVELEVTSAELVTSFGYEVSDKKHPADKIVKVTGTITAQADKQLVLDEQIFIQMNESHTYKIGDKAIIKARCIGYDDLLEEVKLDQGYMFK